MCNTTHVELEPNYCRLTNEFLNDLFANFNLAFFKLFILFRFAGNIRIVC